MKITLKFVGIIVFLFCITSVPHAVVRLVMTPDITVGVFLVEHLKMWLPVGLVALTAYVAQR